MALSESGDIWQGYVGEGGKEERNRTDPSQRAGADAHEPAAMDRSGAEGDARADAAVVFPVAELEQSMWFDGAIMLAFAGLPRSSKSAPPLGKLRSALAMLSASNIRPLSRTDFREGLTAIGMHCRFWQVRKGAVQSGLFVVGRGPYPFAQIQHSDRCPCVLTLHRRDRILSESPPLVE